MTFGMDLVLVISVISMLICVGFTFRFKEVNFFKRRQHEKQELGLAKSFSTLYDAVIFCTRNLRLLIVSLMSILVIGISGILDEYDPLIADRYGLNLALVGVWGSTRYILEAIGGRIAYKLKNIFESFKISDRFYAIFVLCLIAAGLLGVSGWARSILVMPLYGLFYLIMASTRILFEDYVQQQIEEQGRSTVHSLISLMDNLFGIAFFGVYSFVLSGVDLHTLLFFTSLYIVFISVVLWIIYIKVNRRAAS